MFYFGVDGWWWVDGMVFCRENWFFVEMCCFCEKGWSGCIVVCVVICNSILLFVIDKYKVFMVVLEMLVSLLVGIC